MNELHIQRALRTGTTFDTLLSRYAIGAKQSTNHPALWLLKYDQIASPFHEPIVQECRGIILDESDNWEVVSCPFFKFFNYGEGNAADIDWATASVQEKLDGSLAVLYWYGGRWNVQTSGSPDASGDVHGNGQTFSDYFWRVFKTSTDELPTSFCFFFELMGPLNRIVVPHTEERLTVLGGRNLESGEELTPREAADYFPEHGYVRSFPLSDIAGVLASFDTMNPLQQEGYVVCDGAFRRIKVKHPGYVALHHAKDGMTEKAFLDIARKGEVCEVIAAFPEFQPLLDSARERIDNLVTAIDTDYRTISAHVGPEATQKDFALVAKDKPHSAALFALRAGKSPDGRHYVANAPQSWVLKVVGA